MTKEMTLSKLQGTLSPVVKKAYNEGARSYTTVYPQWTNIINSREYYYEDIESSAVGLLQQINELEDIPTTDFNLGSTTQYTPDSYALRITASRLAWKFRRLNLLEQASHLVGQSAKKTIDVLTTNTFINNATTTTTADGQTLASTAHVNLADGSTYANRPASYSSFSFSALDNAYQSMATTERHDVVPGGNIPVAIMFHAQLAAEVHAALKSDKVPGTANNDSNYYFGRLTPIQNDLISNDKAWILLTAKDMHRLNLVWWTNPQMIKWTKDSNQSVNWAVIADFQIGASSGLGVYYQFPV